MSAVIPRAFIVLVAAAGLAAADPGPRADRLVDAYQRGDADGLARLGSTLSATGLSPFLGPNRPRLGRLAGAAAARHADDAWVLLTQLAARAGEPDRPVAALAARSAARIAGALGRERAMELEIPDDALRARLMLWRAVGASPGRWPDVRVHAMSVAQRLRDALPAAARDVDAYDLAARLTDPEPEVRRAALELVPAAEIAAHRVAITARLVQDADPVVAVVAAQVLCGAPTSETAASPAAAALGEPGLERVRKLLGAPAALPPAAVLDAARCLARDKTPTSARVFRRLITRGPRSIRSALRRLPRR